MNDEARSLHIHLTFLKERLVSIVRPTVSRTVRYSNRGDQRGAVMVRISAVVTLTTPGRIGWDGDVLKLPRLSSGRAPVRLGLFICGARSISPVPVRQYAFSRQKGSARRGVDVVPIQCGFLPAFSGG